MSRDLGASLLSVNSPPSKAGFLPLKDDELARFHTGSLELSFETGPYDELMKPHWCIRGCCTRKHWWFKGRCYRGCCSCCCTWTFLGLLFLAMTLTLFIGAAIQRGNVADAGDTSWIYDTPEVCGFSGMNYPNASDAHVAGDSIEHCGQCGSCSNEQDINIYNTTAETLTNAATKCAFLSFIGADYVRTCLERNVGFTTGCNDCWVDNVMCDQIKCKWICLLSILSGQKKNDSGSAGLLNQCIECDEQMCGTAFIKCAGANRRRAGIPSDIGRMNLQLCTVVDPAPANISLG